jgi:hypothetical protein
MAAQKKNVDDVPIFQYFGINETKFILSNLHWIPIDAEYCSLIMYPILLPVTCIKYISLNFCIDFIADITSNSN